MKRILMKAIEEATDYLIGMQGSEGNWTDFQLDIGSGSSWVTAYVATALTRVSGAETSVEKACQWLVKNLREGRGWGFNESVPTDCDSTAWSLLALSSAGFEIPKDIKTLLRQYRTKEGLYRTFVGHPEMGCWCEAHIDVTAVALRALCIMGGESIQRLYATVYKLIEVGENDGWHAYWWKSDIYAISQVLEALSLFFSKRLTLKRINTRATHQIETRLLWRRANVLYNACEAELDNDWYEEDPFELALRIKALIYTDGIKQSIFKRVHRLIELQEQSGRWRGKEKLRVTNRSVSRPWEDENSGPLFIDQSAIFTTTTGLEVLTLARKTTNRDNAECNLTRLLIIN